MSVLIKGMEMPNNCGECQFCHTENFTQWCCPTGREDIFYDAVPQWCPLDAQVKWIPVTERLPEEGWCLCTVHGVFYDYCEILLYQKRKRKMRFFRLDDDGEYVDFTDRVMAWMPLPMPWKGEEE